MPTQDSGYPSRASEDYGRYLGAETPNLTYGQSKSPSEPAFFLLQLRSRIAFTPQTVHEIYEQQPHVRASMKRTRHTAQAVRSTVKHRCGRWRPESQRVALDTPPILLRNPYPGSVRCTFSMGPSVSQLFDLSILKTLSTTHLSYSPFILYTTPKPYGLIYLPHSSGLSLPSSSSAHAPYRCNSSHASCFCRSWTTRRPTSASTWEASILRLRSLCAEGRRCV